MDKKLAGQYQYFKEIIASLTIMDDIFMRNVFKKKECTEHVLRIIMKKKDLVVNEQFIQMDYKNLQGRSATLDCVATDSESKIYNIELQQASEGASPKRARYHSGLMDMNTLKSGEDFEQLPESYMIFITKHDVLGQNQPIYHIERRIRETGSAFRDDAYIIYVDSSKQDDTELGRLMHDLNSKNADEIYSEVLADRVKELKESKGGIDVMSSIMEQFAEKFYKEGVEYGTAIGQSRAEMRGIEKGRYEAKREAAIALYKADTPIDKIAAVLKVDTHEVETWIEEDMVVAK